MRIVLVFACFVLFCAAGTKACPPDPVFNVYLTDTTLSWDPSTNCNMTYYIVTIHDSSGATIEYVYQTEGLNLDVSFLPFCKSYIFTVFPVSENIGPYTQILDIMVLPAGTDITITNFIGSQIDNDVLLQWDVLPEHLYCLDNYRLLLRSEDSDAPEEITTNQNSYNIKDVAQCMSYQLQISVVYQGTEYPVSEFSYTVPEATNSPSLNNVIQDALTINTTWALESYAVNRCNVSALNVISSSYNTTISILDTPERPTINVNVSGLRANSMYYFNVTVDNEAGTSRPFQLAVQTLPIE